MAINTAFQNPLLCHWFLAKVAILAYTCPNKAIWVYLSTYGVYHSCPKETHAILESPPETKWFSSWDLMRLFDVKIIGYIYIYICMCVYIYIIYIYTNNIVQYCTVQYCIVQYCIVLYRTVYCTTVLYTVLYCIVLYSNNVSCCTSCHNIITRQVTPSSGN